DYYAFGMEMNTGYTYDRQVTTLDQARDKGYTNVERVKESAIISTKNGGAYVITQAGIARDAWSTVNRTGISDFEKRLTDQLTKNRIPNGTNTIRSGNMIITY